MRKGKLISPIIVNEFFGISEGQHRFTALRRMGEAISYMVGEGYGLKETQVYNSNSKNWNTKTILNSYCDSGNIHYVKLRDFHEKYQFAIFVCTDLLSGKAPNNKEVRQKFINGDFVVVSLDKATDFANQVVSISEYCPDVYRHVKFISAMINCFNTEGYNHSTFMTRLTRRSDIINNARGTTKSYREAIHNVYNFNTTQKNKLELREL